MSRPTSKNSAVASMFGFDVLSCVAQGGVMGDCDATLTLAQMLSVEEAKVQSALPGVVRRHRLGPAGVAQGPAPGHSITLSVGTDGPVGNSPTSRRRPSAW